MSDDDNTPEFRATIYSSQASTFTGKFDIVGTRGEIRRTAEENKSQRIVYNDEVMEVWFRKEWHKALLLS